MQFEVKTITDKNIWEKFLSEKNEKTFLQSWNWGEFEKSMGHKVWRLGVQSSKFKVQSSKLVAVAQVVLVEARRGRHLLVSHGPIIKRLNLKHYKSGRSANFVMFLEVLVSRLKEIAKEEKCIFIRVVPIWEREEENEKIFKDLGFKRAPMHTHPELTWQLNLIPSEDELLLNMRKTTRYLIRQGLRDKDLKIIKSQDVGDVDIFNQLYQKTVVRHHFVPFSLNYLKNEFLAFSGDPSPSLAKPVLSGSEVFARAQDDNGEKSQSKDGAIIFLAKYKDEPMAGAMVIFWQGIGFYHQGASSQKYSKIPASYLLQWEAIKEAKKRGCTTYNFWGIADVNSKFKVQSSKLTGSAEFKKHPWAGLSLFKMGFGGYPRTYVKTQDLPLAKRYWLTYFFEKVRKKKRGF